MSRSKESGPQVLSPNTPSPTSLTPISAAPQTDVGLRLGTLLSAYPFLSRDTDLFLPV